MVIQILLIALLTFCANVVGIVSGFGVGTVMTPILVMVMPFSEAILLICIIHWFHDIWKMSFYRHAISWKLFAHFGIPTVVASVIGALFVTPNQSDLLTSMLGIFLLIVVGLLYFMPKIKLANSWLNGTVGGVVSGFFAGMFGIRGAVRSLFLVGMNIPKEVFIGTTGLISICLDSARLLVYYAQGLSLEHHLYVGMLLFIPVSFIGSWVGHQIVQQFSYQKFRMVVTLFLLIVGVKLLLAPWLY